MDIEHTFTDEANRVLDEEVERLGKKLKEEAINEAFRSRGKPVEVTGSDVRRAAEHFRKKKEELGGHRFTDMLLRGYLWSGVAVICIGLILMFSEPILPRVFGIDPGFLIKNSRVALLMGVGLVLIAVVLRRYLRTILR